MVMETFKVNFKHFGEVMLFCNNIISFAYGVDLDGRDYVGILFRDGSKVKYDILYFDNTIELNKFLNEIDECVNKKISILTFMYENGIYDFNPVDSYEIDESEGGFTLIELLVVITILSILVSIGIPIYKNYVRDAERVAIQDEIKQCFTMFTIGKVEGDACRILKSVDPQAIAFVRQGNCYKIENRSHIPVDNVIDYNKDTFKAYVLCEDGKMWIKVEDK